MKSKKYYFNWYVGMLTDVNELINRFGIKEKDNALWDILHFISYELHGDWMSWLMVNDTTLPYIVKHNSFEEMPAALQKSVINSFVGYGQKHNFPTSPKWY